MSVNDTNLGKATGVDIHPGIANPTCHSNTNPMRSNFVEDPTTHELGAGAGRNFDGHKQAARNYKQTAGVIEARPGIIESSHIAPFNETPMDGEEWKSLTPGRLTPGTLTPGTSTPGTSDRAAGIMDKSTSMGSAGMAGGAARMARLVDDEKMKKSGKA